MYCKSALLLIKVIIGPMSESACYSLFQSCFERFAVLSTTRLLAITKIVPVGTLGMELSPLYPLLIIALTAVVSRLCSSLSCSQGIPENASPSIFSVPLCNVI